MHNILLKIIEKKKQDLVLKKPKLEIEIFKQSKQKDTLPNNKFRNSILSSKELALIGEIKFASPSTPLLGSKKDLLSRAKKYEESGVNAISIITEPHYFKGDIKFVAKVKKHVALPILQKDFVIDAAQIYEAKQIGSDALLLIARLVDQKTLKIFVSLCQDLGIEPVVEINNENDLNKAIKTSTKIIAVNARDLETFVVDVSKACDLLNKIPDKFIKLGFSGIISDKEILEYKKTGAKGVLVGTSLMQAKNIKIFIKSLVSSHSGKRSASRISKRSLVTDSGQARMTKLKKSVKVKICGIRDLASAKVAVAAGADFLGFNFVPTSKRYLDQKSAEHIISKIKGKIKTVGVFQNLPIDKVNKIAERLDLDYVQLHGDEDVEYRKKIKSKIIQKIHKDGSFTDRQNCEYFLLDREVQGQGKMIDLKIAKELTNYFRSFIAGGLTPENVKEVVRKVKPFAVDVAGGVETEGKPDVKKIELFIKNAK